MIQLLILLRFFQVVGGVATGELRIESAAFPAAVSALVATPSIAIVDVTNHPEFVVGCTFSGAATPNTKSTAQVVDTCVAPAAVKIVPSTTAASTLTALEWTAFQAKISSGSAPAAGDLATLLRPAAPAETTAALNDAAALGILTPARAAALAAALTAAAL